MSSPHPSGAPPAGDPAAAAIRMMAASPPLRDLVSDVIEEGWARWGLPRQDVTGILAAAMDTPDDATRTAFTAAPYLCRPDLAFADGYAAARAAKFDVVADLIAPHVRPGPVCDMGAGDVQLISRLAQRTKSGSRFVATDVFGEPLDDGDVSFVLQEQPDRLPLADSSTATVIATGMLHHMSAEVRSRLLDDVRRCLTPDGALILLEDTYPAMDWPSRDDVDERFQALSSDDRWGFLAATDWWGNRVMKNLPDVPLPCTFLDLAGWRVTLAAAGLAVRSADYLGVVDCGGHMATPRSLVVVEPIG